VIAPRFKGEKTMGKVKLATPIEVSGVKTDSLTMREPKVRDMLAAEKIGKSGAEREIAMFAMLCEVTSDEIESLSMRDYGSLQETYSDFLS
jgi:hypothetical protein